jgi:hypothetical protein
MGILRVSAKNYHHLIRGPMRAKYVKCKGKSFGKNNRKSLGIPSYPIPTQGKRWRRSCWQSKMNNLYCTEVSIVTTLIVASSATDNSGLVTQQHLGGTDRDRLADRRCEHHLV